MHRLLLENVMTVPIIYKSIAIERDPMSAQNVTLN